jgi:hypothetical protein
MAREGGEKALLIETKIITNAEVEIYRESKYEVITIVPLVENPKMSTYIFDQEELDDFLEGYGEYAEFIISVKQASAKV